MAEEGGDLLHLHLLAAGGAESDGLEERRRRDEGVVVPESDGVRHRGVSLGEELLEVVDLEQIRDRLVAAKRALAFPPLVADLLLLRCRARIQRTNHRHRQQENRHRRFLLHFFYFFF